MDLIKTVFAGLGAGVAGFIGHLLAHDFVEVTPKFAQAIIRLSTRLLTDSDRLRYSEEWLADLNERVGVFAKLTHAVGCLACVWRIRRQSLRNNDNNIVVRFEVGPAQSIDLDYSTSVLVLEAIHFGIRATKYPWLRNSIAQRLFRAKLAYQLRHEKLPDRRKALRLVSMIDEPHKLRDLQIWIDGELVERPTHNP
jgi:hypothetical protein